MLPSDEEEKASVGASASGAGMVTMAGGALSLAGCHFSASHLAFLASSNVSKRWCIIADKRIISWWGIFDRLSASADRWGRNAVDLLGLIVRRQRRNARLGIQQGNLYAYLIISALIIFIQGNAVDPY